MNDDSIDIQLQANQLQLQPKNKRPDPKMASMIITRKYEEMQPIHTEAVLFIFIFVSIMNQWFYYDEMVKGSDSDFGFWVSVTIEWSVSLYYCWDCYQKREVESNALQYMNFLCGPLQLGLDVIYFMQNGRLYWLSIFVKSFKLITSEYQSQIISDIHFSFTKTMPLFCTCILIITIFAYLFTVFYDTVSFKYFGNVGRTSLTLMQILTFDGWGDLTRQLYMNSGILVIFFMFVYITIMAFYFVYIIQAFQIDVLILQESIKLQQVQMDSKLAKQLQVSLIKQIMIDAYYKRSIVIIGILQLIVAFQQKQLSVADDKFYVFFNLSISGLYTIHFILLNLLEEQYVTSVYDTRFFRRMHMICHFLSGPLALSITVYEYMSLTYIRHGPTLLLFKIFTNENIRNISYISLRILPQSVAPYVCMLGLTFLTSFFMSEIHTKKLGRWFDGYGTAMLTYFQVITLDDWDAGLAKKLIKQGLDVECIFIVLFMVLTNYILIPAFVAQSCEIFQSMLGTCFTPRLKEENHVTFFDHRYKAIHADDINHDNDNYEVTINIHVKEIIEQLLQHARVLFTSIEYPETLKTIYKLIVRRERVPRLKASRLPPEEYKMCEILKMVQTYDQNPEIIIEYQGEQILIDEFNAGFLKLNVKLSHNQ